MRGINASFLLWILLPSWPGHQLWLSGSLHSTWESEPAGHVTKAARGLASVGLFLPGVSMSLSRTSGGRDEIPNQWNFFFSMTKSERINWMDNSGTETILFSFAP